MMIKINIAAALVAGAVSSASATLSWIKANGVCAGGYENCANTAECTYTGLGPCTGTETEPKWHVATTFVGLAFVSDGYTADFANKAKVVEPKQGAKGFRKADANQVDAGVGTEYAYAMSANMFGDSNGAYGYAGFASYLNTGTKDISVDKNKFYSFSDFNTDFTSPDTYDICISKMAGTTCGAKRTFAPGAYKFSLFGSNLGTNWKTTIASFNTATSTKTHMGFRMKIEAKGITFNKVTLNGNIDIAQIGETDVTSIAIANDETELKYTFPKDFNYGKASTITTDGDAGLKTGSIKVVVSLVPNDNNALHIDYLFPMDKIGTDGDQYFVYDPEVTGKDANTAGNGAGQLAMSGLVAVVAAAVSQLF
jgi:hypothetical protein